MIKFIDFFCGGGSVSKVFKIVFPDSYILGVDNTDRNYPFDFLNTDFRDNNINLNDFNILWASPPCQRFSKRVEIKNRIKFPDYINTVREMFINSNKIYFIENVPGSPLHNPIVLNGKMFGKNFYHASWFETNLFMLTSKINHVTIKNNYPFNNPGKNWNMEIGFKRSSDWIKANSIPIVYTKFLFNELKRQIKNESIRIT
jgi:hypothetical protein